MLNPPACHIFADWTQIAANKIFIFASQKQRQVSCFLRYATMIQKHANPLQSMEINSYNEPELLAEASHSYPLLNKVPH